MPNAYELAVGDKVEENIVSTRPVVDQVATERRALEQANQISEVFLRSEEISSETLLRLEDFLNFTRTTREELKTEGTGDQAVRIPVEALQEASNAIVSHVQETHGIILNTTDVSNLLSLNESIFTSITGHIQSIGASIMATEQDSYSLRVAISSQVETVITNNAQYQQEYSVIGNFLRNFLEPNLVIDEQASQAAKDQARQQVWASPILIPSGSIIVNAGETLNQVQYDALVELDLIRTGELNVPMLISLSALYLFSLLVIWLYLTYYEKRRARSKKDWFIAAITSVAVILIGSYVVRFSPLLIPVCFVAIILSSYYGLRTSLVFTSMLILLMYPITGLDPKFLFVAILGSWTAAMITASQAKSRNYLSVIMATTLACLFASVLYSTLTQEPNSVTFESMLLATVSGAVSSVLAIGLSPVFEAVVSQVSPTKLIRLSDPSQPLLRKLFLEAPGTYQHSMMIANLAETAAERIGADALLIRVGAYYHDIGKTWNPQMYTENQQGFNPHSLLTTEESVRVIMRHVTAGEELGRRNRLPQEIIDFMITHHGTTVLQYFFAQATKEAEEKGMEAPDPKDFTYPGMKPNSKETGIFMIADTVEAAMKSSGYTHLDDAEVLIRNLVRKKIEQNQLVDSGLSFREVEEIIQAFLQVYAGQFHERIKYPDANTIPQSTR